MNTLHTKSSAAEEMFGLMKLPIWRLPIDLTRAEWGKLSVYFPNIGDLALTTRERFLNTKILRTKKRNVEVLDALAQLGIEPMHYGFVENSIYALLTRYGALNSVTLYDILPYKEILDGFDVIPGYFISKRDEENKKGCLTGITIGEFQYLAPLRPHESEATSVTLLHRSVVGHRPTEAFFSKMQGLEVKLREVMPY